MGEQVAAAVGKSWLDGVFTDLEGAGYACEAAVLPACAVDAPHRRDRLWFVADAARELPHGAGGEGNGRAEYPDRSAVANASGGRRAGSSDRQGELARRAEAIGASEGDVAHAASARRGQAGCDLAGDIPADGAGAGDWPCNAGSPWGGYEWATGADGKARRVKSGLRLLAHGVPARVGRLRAYGNAIVPPLAAEVIKAYLEVRP
jgi:DNA (cytosine-5)-methyltransferase 1